GNQVRLVNQVNTVLGDVNAETLNVNVTGNLADADGTVITVNGTSNLTASGDIVLDGINGVSTHQLGEVTASAGNVNLVANDMLINQIAAQSTITLQSNGQITDANAAGVNLIAEQVQLTAQTGIDLDLQAEVLNIVNTTSGEVNIENTEVVLVELLRNAGGDITFENQQQVTIDRIETAGHLDMTIRNGDIRGEGLTPAHTEADADIVAASADFLALRGSFGTLSRPIVAYIPGDITVFSRISFSPVFLPTEPLDRIADTSLLKFSALDTLSSLAGEQVVEVESLDDVDPAIFTNIQNYNMSDIAIRMPKDQLFEDETE
ncbi:MAG: hypothetical protein HYZ31_02945, partial [Gammaproteobacteria bacterium]|nr:hypothetical protein [Gammaproteobacteria bacterium]